MGRPLAQPENHAFSFYLASFHRFSLGKKCTPL